jgi:hypothetical protein
MDWRRGSDLYAIGAALAVGLAGGVATALAGPLPMGIVLGLLAVLLLFTLSVETLVGLWLVGALIDPVIPSIFGFPVSDVFLVLALVQQYLLRSGEFPKLPSVVACVLMLAWLAEVVVSLLEPHVTSQNSRFLATLAALTLVVCLVWTVPRPLVWIKWVLGASLLAAMLAGVQYVVFRATGVIIFPRPQNLFLIRTGLAQVFKASGLGMDPNFLAMWILPGAGIALVCFLRRIHRRLTILAFGVCVFGIIATGSRGALVSLVLGSGIVFAVDATSRRRKSHSRILRSFALGCLLLVLLPAAQPLWSHVVARDPANVQTRTSQIPLVVHDAVHGNWTGKGYEAEVRQVAGEGTAYLRPENVVHNTLLQALYEVGWLGFSGALLILLSGVVAAFKVIPASGNGSAAMLGAAFVFIAICMQGLGAYGFRPLWLVWALLIYAYVQSRQGKLIPHKRLTGIRRPAGQF